MTAATPGFRLRFLGFYGPQKQPSSVTFGPGLNVIYGAGDGFDQVRRNNAPRAYLVFRPDIDPMDVDARRQGDAPGR